MEKDYKSKKEKQKVIGCGGIIAYGLFGLAIVLFIYNMILGERKDEYGGWISYDDIISMSGFLLIIGVIFYIIDRIRNKKYE